MNRTDHPMDWTTALRDTRATLGLPVHHDGCFWLRMEGAPEVAAELLAEGVLTAHAQVKPEGALDEDGELDLAGLLAANRPDAMDRGAIHAIDPVSGDIVLYRRFEDCEAVSGTQLMGELVYFAAAARGFADAPTTMPAPSRSPASPRLTDPQETFRQAWEEYVYMHRLEGDAGTSAGTYFLDVEDGPPVVVDLLPGQERVIVKTLLALMPTEAADEAALLRKLLQAQLLGEVTEGAVFALDEDDTEIIVYRDLDLAALRGDQLRIEAERVAGIAAAFRSALGLPALVFDLA